MARDPICDALYDVLLPVSGWNERVARGAFLAHCARRGIQPCWDCCATNTPSIRVAEKIGLELIEEYEVCCGRFENLPNQS